MKYIIPFFIVLFASPVFALTDVILNDPTVDSSYELAFIYDDATETLLPSKSTTTAYRIIRQDFIPSATAFESGFLGILIGPKEKILQRFGIPKPTKILTGAKVAYTTPGPYHPSGERIDVYQGSKKLFTVDVSGSRMCVEDGTCAFDAGESQQNCPLDCTSVPPPASVITRPAPAPLPTTPGALPPRLPEENTGVVSKEVSSPIFSAIFFVLGLASFGIWVYIKRKNAGE